MTSFLTLAAFLTLLHGTAHSFSPRSRSRPCRRPVFFAFPSDGIGNSPDDENDDDDEDWQIALQKRQLSLQQREAETQQRWLVADFEQVAVGLPDWVRRVSVQWPLAACGSAKGDVYVVNCESGTVLGRGESADDQRRYADVPLEPKVATTMKQLFGDFDGGGTLAVGFSWNSNIIAHAGRDGGVELWKMNSPDFDLVSLGTLLEDDLVTCLDWAQDDSLWIGTQDGRVIVYDLEDIEDEDDEDLSSKSILQEWKDIRGTVTSVKFNEELGVAVATTTTGVVELMTLDDPTSRRSFYPPFDSGRMRSNVFPLCAVVLEQRMASTTITTTGDNPRQFAIACGGNDGSVYIQPLRLSKDSTVIDPQLDLDRPFGDMPIKTLVPNHRGPCKCLVSPFPGILLSGGQDGTIRVWDLNAKDDKSSGLYLLSGFKVWLGSLWTDGERLVMDGSDNALSIFNFGQRDD